MEVVRTKIAEYPTPNAAFANDNHRADQLLTPSVFPKGAAAIIFQPARSCMSSGRANSGGWRLVFERRSAPYLEPLMGWTSDDDPLAQVELSFPTLRSAIRYAERQGLSYGVQTSQQERADRPECAPRVTRAFSDATLERLGLGALQNSYMEAVAGAEARHDRRGDEGWTCPMAVAKDAALSIEAKRSILINWAWTEFLMEHANSDQLSDHGRPSRLREVELALLELERATIQGQRKESLEIAPAAPAGHVPQLAA